MSLYAFLVKSPVYHERFETKRLTISYDPIAVWRSGARIPRGDYLTALQRFGRNMHEWAPTKKLLETATKSGT